MLLHDFPEPRAPGADMHLGYGVFTSLWAPGANMHLGYGVFTSLCERDKVCVVYL